MEIDNAWLQLLNSQKEKAYEHLESIYQDMYKRIEFLEKENEVLKSGAVYKQLTKENEELNKHIIVQNNYFIDEKLLDTAHEIITEHYNKYHEDKTKTKIGMLFHYKINQPNGITVNGKYVVCDLCNQEFLLNPND